MRGNKKHLARKSSYKNMERRSSGTLGENVTFQCETDTHDFNIFKCTNQLKCYYF